MSFLSTWYATIISDLSTLTTTLSYYSPKAASFVDAVMRGGLGGTVGGDGVGWSMKVRNVKDLQELLKDASTFSVPGKEVLLTFSTTVQSNLNGLQSNLNGLQSNLNSLPDITASLVTQSSSYSTYIWDVLQANLGMPILVLRSLSIYVLFLCLLTVIPGFLNVASGKLLRWPILLMTYFQILIELLLYAVLRLFIKAIEILFQSSTHRRMRRKIWLSSDYQEWLDQTRALDKSQGRDWWQRTVSDEVSSRYNWAFISELMKVR